MPDPQFRPPQPRIAGEREHRFQVGAYLTDGVDLFEVLGVRHGRGPIGSVAMRLILEDCYTLRRVEFLLDKIRRRFRVVRGAPPATS